MATSVEASRVSEVRDRSAERADAFRRVAGHRANRALGYVESLLHTADRSRYAYTDEQVAEVVGKLQQAVDQLAAAYKNTTPSLRVEL